MLRLTKAKEARCELGLRRHHEPRTGNDCSRRAGRSRCARTLLRCPRPNARNARAVGGEPAAQDLGVGPADLSRRIITKVMERVDVAYAEEWKFDHGIMVPLNFLTPRFNLPLIPANINCQGPPLTPLSRAYEFGRAIRGACDAVPERIALVGTGGISHWPATPNSGRINVEWDREFLTRWTQNDRDALTSYTDSQTLRDAGQGGFEIRTLTAVAGACEGQKGKVWFCHPIPIFATSGFVAVMDVQSGVEAVAA